ncbi:hypothetical protein PMAYCL1PPCAC_30920, partial [Pristionchus mayeri]
LQTPSLIDLVYDRQTHSYKDHGGDLQKMLEYRDHTLAPLNIMNSVLNEDSLLQNILGHERQPVSQTEEISDVQHDWLRKNRA